MAISQLKAKYGRQQDGLDEESSTSASSASASSNKSASTIATELTFKCLYDEETRIIKAQPNITFEKMAKKLKSAFGHRMCALAFCALHVLISL